MKRTISSSQTWLLKFVSPVLLVSVLPILLVFSVHPIEGTLWLGAFVVWGMALVLWLVFGLPVKQVEVDDKHLVVSNYRTSIRIPLEEIEDVREGFFIKMHPIWVKLKQNTPFGKTIMFVPRISFRFSLSHPIVSELKALAAALRDQANQPSS